MHSHQSCRRRAAITDRREFLRRAGAGFGMLALADLLREPALRADEGLHHPATAKSVIWLFMEGGPSGFDLFDPKPELQKRHGQRVGGIETHFGNPGPLLQSPYKFAQHGDSGAWVCEAYPNLARCVDDIAFIKSCWAESPNHAPAMYQMNTGLTRPGYPSVGSWITYGLGSENRNLPGYVVMAPGVGKGGPANWGAGFLPSSYQGTLVRSKGQAVLNLNRPGDIPADEQRAMLDLAGKLNGAHAERHPGEAELAGRIASFELAYRMQTEAPEAIDLSKETAETHKLYGIGGGRSDQFGRKCLTARRLIEHGVRFVQVYSDDEWDAHGNIKENHDARCGETDAPIAGLLTDLKRRGLLETTLVVWGGEFGRMPVSEGGKGRDHNPHGFTAWMAGGGIKGGVSHGETDEIGYKAAVNPCSVHDLHATILHALGVDHKKLTFLHNGRRFRLTDVAGNVVKEVLK
jgi:hypothetical protein